VQAVDLALGGNIDFAQLHKIYGNADESRYWTLREIAALFSTFLENPLDPHCEDLMLDGTSMKRTPTT